MWGALTILKSSAQGCCMAGSTVLGQRSDLSRHPDFLFGDHWLARSLRAARSAA